MDKENKLRIALLVGTIVVVILAYNYVGFFHDLININFQIFWLKLGRIKYLIFVIPLVALLITIHNNIGKKK